MKKSKPATTKVGKKDALSCEVCGHFLSMHDDRRGCRVNWCDCTLRSKKVTKESA